MGLPQPLGPFNVSFADFQLRQAPRLGIAPPDTSPTQIADPDPPFVHLAGPDGVSLPPPPLIRIYYPTAKPPHKYLTHGRHWLPSFIYSRGYCSIAVAPISTISSIKCWLAAAFFHLLLKPQAVLASSVAQPPLPPGAAEDIGAPPGRFPVVVFSHGLWSMRATYSAFCSDLASHGYVVAALEHTDGSANMAMSVDESGHARWHPHAPLGISIDEVADEIRHRQLAQRVGDIQSTIVLLDMMTAGAIPDAENVVRGKCRLDPSTILGRLDLRQVAVAGHSFGGLTAALVTAVEPRVACCLALDTWWSPMPEESFAKAAGGRPVLLVNNANFGNNFTISSARKKFLAARAALRSPQSPVTKVLVIKDSNHQDQSDFPLLIPKLAQRVGISGSLGALKTKEITVRACLAFLWDHLLNRDAKVCFQVGLRQSDEEHLIQG